MYLLLAGLLEQLYKGVFWDIVGLSVILKSEESFVLSMTLNLASIAFIVELLFCLVSFLVPPKAKISGTTFCLSESF